MNFQKKESLYNLLVVVFLIFLTFLLIILLMNNKYNINSNKFILK